MDTRTGARAGARAVGAQTRDSEGQPALLARSEGDNYAVFVMLHCSSDIQSQSTVKLGEWQTIAINTGNGCKMMKLFSVH